MKLSVFDVSTSQHDRVLLGEALFKAGDLADKPFETKKLKLTSSKAKVNTKLEKCGSEVWVLPRTFEQAQPAPKKRKGKRKRSKNQTKMIELVLGCADLPSTFGGKISNTSRPVSRAASPAMGARRGARDESPAPRRGVRDESPAPRSAVRDESPAPARRWSTWGR